MSQKSFKNETLVKKEKKEEVQKQRLIIEKIVANNFKSYYGKQVIGPFHKRFTAVVGPNGSGKSNTIECLLFIFGKRASWMRLKKLSELIHRSKNHMDCKEASVQVFFQDINDYVNDDFKYDVVPGSRFSIKRKVNKKSVSSYYINERSSNQQEIIELLLSKGIDLNNNRFLILQGEVEQISMMKPKTGDENKPGLLEYLEDIIGSN